MVLTLLLCLVALVALLASDISYGVWATAGIATAVLLPACFLVGVCVLVAELFAKRLHAVVWPAILMLVSGIPLLLILLVANGES